MSRQAILQSVLPFPANRLALKPRTDYTIDDGKGNKVPLNGNLTSGENIGDTGLIQSYRAWQAQYDSSSALGGEYLLPGLNMTKFVSVSARLSSLTCDMNREQLFFVSFARIWAQNISPAAAVRSPILLNNE